MSFILERKYSRSNLNNLELSPLRPSRSTVIATMKHLILVGACYLDTILRCFISNEPTKWQLAYLPVVYPSSPQKTPSYEPQAALPAVEETVPTH